MERIQPKINSIGTRHLTPEVQNLLKGRTTIKFLTKAQDNAINNYRVKTSESDTLQDYLASKITVSGNGLTVAEYLNTTTNYRSINFNIPNPLPNSMLTNGVLTNDGTTSLWSDILTISDGNANVKNTASLVLNNGSTNSITGTTLGLNGSIAVRISSANVELMRLRNNTAYIYASTFNINSTSVKLGGILGTTTIYRPLLVNADNSLSTYNFQSFPKVESNDGTSRVATFSDSGAGTNTVSIVSQRGVCLQASETITIQSSTNQYIISNIPNGIGTPIVSNGGQLYLDVTTPQIKRAKITLTRAQILALNTTPIQLLPAQTGVLYIPHRFIIKQGATRSYTGTIYVTYGTVYNANNLSAWFALAGGLSTAKYTDCIATATGVVNEGLPIYLTTNNAITDSGTSDSVTFWLEYTVLDTSL